MTNRIQRIVYTLTAAATLTLFAQSTSLSAQQVIEQVLVRVNGDILTKGEFENRQVATLRSRTDLGNISPDSPELQRAIAEITPNLVLAAVDELLMVQRGRDLGFTLGDEQFSTILGNIKKENNLDDDVKFQEALKSEGLTLATLRANLEKQMLVSRVTQQEVLGKISINDEEARAYYDAHKQEFTAPTSITLREILVAVPTSERGINAAEDDEARRKAVAIRSRLLAGEPFARLAGEVSDSGSKANGGLVGPISPQEVAPSLLAIIDKMKVGDVAEPIRTDRGYQILKLEERTEPKVKTFDEARDEIGNRIGDQKLATERVRYLEKLRSEATIIWRNAELEKAYQQALAARQKTS